MNPQTFTLGLFLSVLFECNFVLSTASNSDQVTKCCPKDAGLIQILTNDSYYYGCTRNFSEYILPLRIDDGVIETGIPENCSRKEYCVDKLVENGYSARLQCQTKRKKTDAEILTIHKCCPDFMMYDKTTKACDFDDLSTADLVFDSNSSIYNLTFGVPNCIRAMVDHELEGTFKIVNGDLSVENLNGKIIKTVKEGTYCVDTRKNDRRIMLRICENVFPTCDKIACIPKCCPIGQGYGLVNGKTRCRPNWNVPFEIKYLDSKQVSMPKPVDVAFLQTPRCQRYIGLNYNIFPNGTMHISGQYLHSVYTQFCVEHFETGNKSYFGTLVCFPNNYTVMNFYYLTGLLISNFFLFATLVVYFFLRELQNLHGKTVMCHTASLLASYICLAFVKLPLTDYPRLICLILGYGIMFTFLSAFAWLNVMCFDIWWTFGVVKARGLKKGKNIKKFLLYSLYAYGLPLLVTGITVFLDLYSNISDDYKARIAETSCWFDLLYGPSRAYTIYFCCPVAVILSCNIVLFSLTAKHCIKVRADIKRMQNMDSPKKIRFLTDMATFTMNLKLFIVMGITWVFELISVYVREPEILWYIFDTLNVLQGLWIFCIFVLKRNVWKALLKKVRYQPIRESSQTQTTTLSAKNSVVSMTSLKVNGIIKNEEMNLLQNALKNADNRKSNGEKRVSLNL